jgi:hypothetical protein
MDKETLLQFFNEHNDAAVEYAASKSAEVLVDHHLFNQADEQQALNEIITDIDIIIEGLKEWQKHLEALKVKVRP